jgi:hypothetical protein
MIAKFRINADFPPRARTVEARTPGPPRRIYRLGRLLPQERWEGGKEGRRGEGGEGGEVVILRE